MGPPPPQELSPNVDATRGFWWMRCLTTHTSRSADVGQTSRAKDPSTPSYEDKYLQRSFFKKIRDPRGTFHAKMGTIKDRNGLTQQKQKILRSDGKNTQKNYAKKI